MVELYGRGERIRISSLTFPKPKRNQQKKQPLRLIELGII